MATKPRPWGSSPDPRAENKEAREIAKLRADLAEARKVAAEWRDIADLMACIEDRNFPGFKPDDPESYAFPWESK